MRVRWTTDAVDDVQRICDYIAETSPDSAQRMASTIIEGIASLQTFPNRGRPGRVHGTRESVFAPLSFIAVYEVHEEVQARFASESKGALTHDFPDLTRHDIRAARAFAAARERRIGNSVAWSYFSTRV